MYRLTRSGSGVADADALCNSLRTTSNVEAAFVQVNNYLRLHREHAKDFFRICFPVLLQRIFGFEDHAPGGQVAAPAPSAGGWLQLASAQGKEIEARALLSFLEPGGVLIQALLAVDRDTSVRFVFPPARLPDWVKRLLATSQGAQLLSEQAPVFQGHIVQDSLGRFQVHLDLFHYYLFWFAYYVVCKDTAASRQTRQAQVAAAHGHFPGRRLDPWPALKIPGLPSPSAAPAPPYRDLLRRYLRHFLPYSAPAMLAPPPQTSILRTLSRASSGMPDGRTPQAVSEPSPPLSPGDVLLHTLLTFWLRDDDPAPLSAADQRFTQSTALPLFGGPTPISYPPSGEDLLDCLQILVSYIVANPQLAALKIEPPPATRTRPTFERVLSGPLRPNLPGGTQPSYFAPPLPSASAALQRPLYRLILRALLGWPLQNGGVNKISKIVDIWAAHLQPWGGSQQQQNAPPRQGGFHLQWSPSSATNGAQQTQAKAPAYSEKWKGYVLANYAIYNPLVVHLLEWGFRAVSVDAGAAARIVSKVLSVLQAPPLLDLLRQVEAAYAGHVAARRAPGQQSDLCSTLEEQLRDWESGLVQPAPLLRGVTPASQGPRLRLFAAEDDGGPRLLQSLVHRVQSDAPKGGGPSEAIKQLGGLANAIIAAAGGGERRAGQQPQKQSAGNRNDQGSNQAPSSSDGEPSARGQPKPPVGLQRHTWVDAQYRGDWMRRPIASNEVGWLVRRLVRLSDAVNEALQLGPQFEAKGGEGKAAEQGGGQEEASRNETEGAPNKGAPDKGKEKEEAPSSRSADKENERNGGEGAPAHKEVEVGGYENAIPLPLVAYQIWTKVQSHLGQFARTVAARLLQEARKRHWRVNLRPLAEVQSLVLITLLWLLLWLVRLVFRWCLS